MNNYQTIIDALIAGDQNALTQQVRATLDQGIPAKTILNEALIAGMDIVGQKMEDEDMFIPEVLMAAKAMSAAVEILKPQLADADFNVAGKVIIGTVKGDLHDIGKNLVAMMMESAGFEVTNLGVDVAPEKFLTAAQEKHANMLCISALLTTTMPMMRQTVQAFEEAGIRDQIKIMVGGAPVTQKFADEIKADGYAADAGSATRLAKALLQ